MNPLLDKKPGVGIGLLGPFGVGNLGDASIQEAMIQQIRQRLPDARIFGFSLNPKDTERRHHIPSFPIVRVQKRWMEEDYRQRQQSEFARKMDKVNDIGIIRFLRRYVFRVPAECLFLIQSFRRLAGIDLLVFSGGGQIDDSWGGAWGHPFTMFKWSLLAKLAGVKTALVSLGAGPVDTKIGKFFVRKALSMAGYRSYRDENSRRFVNSLGFRNDDEVFPDLSHIIETNCLQRPEYTSRKRLRVCVGPVPYCHPQEWPTHDPQQYAAYLAKMVSFCGWLLERGHKVVLIPGSVGADDVVIRDIQGKIWKLDQNREKAQVEIPSIRSLHDLLDTLVQTDVVVSSRFHGILLAHVHGKPALGISPHQKIDALMEAMGHSQLCLNIERFTVEELAERFASIERSWKELHEQVENREKQYKRALKEQFDTLYGVAEPAAATVTALTQQ